MTAPFARRSPRRLIASTMAIVCLAFAAPASAQIGLGFGGGPPSGDVVGLVLRGFEGVSVERAEVVLDLREAHASSRVPCEATYTLTNAGPTRDLDVLATAGIGAETVPVAELDGAPVAAAVTASFDPRLAWPMSQHLPSPPGLPALLYRQHQGAASSLRFALPPGTHRLRIRQRVQVQADEGVDHVRGDYQIMYGLAPARGWAGLRELSFRVRVRPGWPAVTAPATTRDADGLVARWTAAPADSIAVSVRTPRPSLRDARALPWVSLAAGLAAVVAGAVAIGRRLARAGRRWRTALLGVPVALAAPGVAYALGDRIAAAIITHRLGFAPTFDIVSRVGDALVMGLGGVVGLVAFVAVSLAAHRHR